MSCRELPVWIFTTAIVAFAVAITGAQTSFPPHDGSVELIVHNFERQEAWWNDYLLSRSPPPAIDEQYLELMECNLQRNLSEGIDIVITWVNGSDPWFLEQLKHYGELHNALGRWEVSGEQRFYNHDELKYALRSIEKYAPWIRHIHLVTNGPQVPGWLIEGHPRLSIVPHHIFYADPVNHLPTFNVFSLHTQVARIPNLTRRFILMDDDMFFGDTQLRSDWLIPLRLPDKDKPFDRVNSPTQSPPPPPPPAPTPPNIHILTDESVDELERTEHSRIFTAPTLAMICLLVIAGGIGLTALLKKLVRSRRISTKLKLFILVSLMVLFATLLIYDAVLLVKVLPKSFSRSIRQRSPTMRTTKSIDNTTTTAPPSFPFTAIDNEAPLWCATDAVYAGDANGGLKLYFTGPADKISPLLLKTNTEWRAIDYSVSLLKRAFGSPPHTPARSYVSHMPTMIDREVWREIAMRWPAEVLTTASHRFRNMPPGDIHTKFMHHNYLQARSPRTSFDLSIINEWFDAYWDLDHNGILSECELAALGSWARIPDRTLLAALHRTAYFLAQAVEDPNTPPPITAEVVTHCPQVAAALRKTFYYHELACVQFTTPNKREQRAYFAMIGDDLRKAKFYYSDMLRKRPKIACINDDRHQQTEESTNALVEFYEKYFPEKSSFER